jgi:flagellar biosynthesis/type III secretory pathway chaperone
MNTLLQELIETFERLSVVYDDLLDTAKAKQQYLISGNIEGLETLLYQEKNQAELAQLLESKRQNILEYFLKEHHIEDPFTMKSLMSTIDSLHSNKLSALVDRLKQSIKQLQDLNETNATLTHYSLDITEDIVKIFCSSSFPNPIYQHSGKIQGNEIPMVLIDTEI